MTNEEIINKYNAYKSSTNSIPSTEYIDINIIHCSVVSPSGGGYVWYKYMFDKYIRDMGIVDNFYTFEEWDNIRDNFANKLTKIKHIYET